MNEDNIGKVSSNTAEDIADIMFDDDLIRSTYEFRLRLTHNAQGLAEEVGRKPEDSFEDEELYKEVVRRSTTPEKFAASHLRVIRDFTLENTNSIFERMILEMASQHPLWAMLRGLMGEEQQKAFLERYLQQNPEFREGVKTRFLNSRRGTAQAVIAQIERYWGAGSANMLPQEQRLALLFTDEDLED